jgi:hypothetical protein
VEFTGEGSTEVVFIEVVSIEAVSIVAPAYCMAQPGDTMAGMGSLADMPPILPAGRDIMAGSIAPAFTVAFTAGEVSTGVVFTAGEVSTGVAFTAGEVSTEAAE